MSVEIATAVLTTTAPVVAKAVWEALREGLKTRGVQQVPEQPTPETIEQIQIGAKTLRQRKNAI
jgi:hypothetical protein